MGVGGMTPNENKKAPEPCCSGLLQNLEPGIEESCLIISIPWENRVVSHHTP